MLRRDTLDIGTESLPEKRKYVYETFFFDAPSCIAASEAACTFLSLPRLQIGARSRIITGLFVRASTDLAA
jgi:hypothetical protein